MASSEHYLILFADLVGSTEVASEVTPSFFAETYIASFHWAARRAWDFVAAKSIYRGDRLTKTIDPIRVAGDEVLSFTPLQMRKGRLCEDMAASAVAFAYVTKLYWLASPYNLRRMLDKQFPRDLAVGLHIGPAALVPDRDRDPNRRQIASLHLNVTKRIENAAREGLESRIFASSDVVDLYQRWIKRHADIEWELRAPLTYADFLDRPGGDVLKGMPKKVHLFELIWPQGDQNAFMSLLGHLTLTPEKDDSETERAARFLAEHFLDPLSFFRYDKKIIALETAMNGGKTPETYIAKWFKAVAGPNKLFFDECWLVLNAFLVSVSLLRHPNVTPVKRKRYLKIAKTLLERLKEFRKVPANGNGH